MVANVYRTKLVGDLPKIAFYLFVAPLSFFFAIGLFTCLAFLDYFNIFSVRNISYFYLIVSPIPAFAFVALIVKWADFLKLAKLKILFLMLGLNVLGMAPTLFVSNFNTRFLILTVLSSVGIFLAFIVSNAVWKLLKGKADFYFQILCAAFCIPFVVSAYFFGISFQGDVAGKIFNGKTNASKCIREYGVSDNSVLPYWQSPSSIRPFGDAVSDNSVLPYWQSARSEIPRRYGFRDFSKELDSVNKCRFEKTKDGGKKLSFGWGHWAAGFSFGAGGAQDIEESNLYFNNSGFLLPCAKSGGDEYVSANFKSTADGGWSASAEIGVYSGSKIIKKYQLSGEDVVKKIAAAEARIEEIKAMWRTNSQKRK